MNTQIQKLNKKAEGYSKKINQVLNEIKKIIVGQTDILNKIVLAVVAEGHILLEGVPGLAKTLMVKTLSDTINSKFCRIQFTPDLLPADITGTKIYNHKDFSFMTKKGPIFNNFILADEVNRAPPKVQSALLEAMQEHQVSIQGDSFKLEKPFLVLATQNPIETEGTYKLPEAQVDRFMFKLLVNYPNKSEEQLIIKGFTNGKNIKTKKIITAKELIEIQKFTKTIYVDEKIEQYVANLIHATRYPEKYHIDCDGHIEYGASPRASINIILGAKAHALLNARGYVTPEDVQAVAYEVLRHRILLTYEAEAENITTDDIIKKILETIKVP
jgi:MoxR-like ATPase